MAEKISIDGNLIGTTAENVEYTKTGWTNATNAKTALDDLQTRLSEVEENGGGSSSNADLAMLADKLLVAGGVNAGKWIGGATYYQLRSDYTGLNNWATQDVTFNPSSLTDADSYCRTSFRVYKGDVIHHKGLGKSYFRPFVVTDLNYKVVYLPDLPQGDQNTDITASGTYTVTEDGWVFAVSVLKSGDISNKYIYAQWADRKTLKGEKNIVYTAFGDSISTDSAFSDQRPVAYPRILAGLIHADLDRHSLGGANITSMYTGSSAFNWLNLGRSDADLVTIMFGANDQTQISDSYTIGTAEDVMALDLTNDHSTLMSTFIGRYRVVLDAILERAPKAKVVCISPTPINSQSAETKLATMRTELSALVTAMDNSRLLYVNGKSMLDYNAYYYLTGDATHPNMIGEYVMAHNLYDKCVKDALGL